MAYTKVYSFIGSNSTSNTTHSGHLGWKYFFETFLPTVGWTVTLCNNNSANPPTSMHTDHWYFMKKTLTFTDGTTDDISFVYNFQPQATDLHIYSWDGVLATNDSSNAQFGRGSTDHYSDTSNQTTSLGTTNHFEIWKDDNSDSWFWLKNGAFIGFWLPNGGWVRQDFTYASGTDILVRHVIPYIGFDEGGKMARHYNGNSSVQIALPVNNKDAKKVSTYTTLECNGYAMWRGTNSDILSRASSTAITPSNRLYTKTLKSGANYYFGMTDSSGNVGIHFNVGTTDPGYN